MRVCHMGIACKSTCMQETDDIRGISDQFCSGGNTETTAGHSNMVWGFGQLLGEPPPAYDVVHSHALPQVRRCS